MRKLLSILIALCMAVTIVPALSYAEGENPDADQPEVTEPLVPPADPADPAEPATDPNVPTEPAAGPTDPTDPTDPTEPTEPAPRPWVTPSGNKNLDMSLCMKDGEMFNLTKEAGQVLYGYDTLQGACANDGFGYFILYNRKNNYDKIVKVDLETMTVVQVSAAMKLNHSNEIAYNTRKNVIVVAESTPVAKRVAVVNAKTLKIAYRKKISVSKVKGMTKKQKRKYQGIGAIAYNEKHNCYVARTRKTYDLLILDSNLNAIKRIKPASKISYLHQGLESYEDSIMVVQSFTKGKPYNKVSIYNFSGKLQARYTCPKGAGMELETIFHDGRQFYAGFYRFFGSTSDNQKTKVNRVNYVYKINNL